MKAGPKLLRQNDQSVCFAEVDPAFPRDVLNGLASRPRTIPARRFYDRAGSELFEAITSLPECYVARTERALLCSVSAIGRANQGPAKDPASRTAQPDSKRFTVRRIDGMGNLWVTEFTIAYGRQPSWSVSVMEFRDGKVARETQYFADPFEPGHSRAQWVQQVD